MPVDRLEARLPYAKAVGIQPRVELKLPGEVPCRFARLPQYGTERVLEERSA